MRLLSRVASAAWSSKPISTPSSASTSSPASIRRSVGCMLHAAGGLGDDVGIAGVGLGRARMQIGDPTHRQPGQIGHLAADRAGDRDRQRADGGRLIDDDQHRPLGLQITEQLTQPSLVLRQFGVVQSSSDGVEGDRVVGALADVQAAEDRVAGLVHRCASPHPMPVLAGQALDAGSHVTKRPVQRAAMSLSAVHQCHQAR